MNKPPYTKEEADKLLYIAKWFSKPYSFRLPVWVEKHNDPKTYCQMDIIGRENTRFKTTVRTCGKDSESSYQNVTLIEMSKKIALARMDTGTKSHFDKATMKCIRGPHIHIYDAEISERAYTANELLGDQENDAKYIEAFWKHFNIDTGNITIMGDLFYGQDN